MVILCRNGDFLLPYYKENEDFLGSKSSAKMLFFGLLLCRKGSGERMTDAQARQIQEMRMKGSGYKAISAAIGLSRDIVRNYCKKHNLAGYAAVVSKNVKLMADGKEV